MKENHSKVKEVKHKDIAMQDYLKPSKEVITRKQAQLIFKLRCKVTGVKMNMKGKFDELNCRACNMKEETQGHILECEKLNEGEIRNERLEGIFKGNLAEKIRIAKHFEENFTKLESILSYPDI